MQNSKKGVFIILGFFLILFLLIPVLRPDDRSAMPATNAEPDYKGLTHQTAVNTIKDYLISAGVTKFDHLGWYYPETYSLKDNVHYSESKVDFWGTDHSYTVGVTFDTQNAPTPVFMMIDGEILLKPAPTADESFALNAARSSVVAAASNPRTVQFDKNSTLFQTEDGYLKVIERFDYVDAAGVPTTKEYYAYVSVAFGKAETVSLSIGDTMLFDNRENAPAD